MAEVLADECSSNDRRAVIGAGVRRGSDTVIAEMRANADLWIAKGTSTIIATRGERLALSHARFSGSDQEPQAFVVETLAVGEINGDGRIVAFVTFDLDDIDAAFEELDARYVAGEAADHAHTWSVISNAYAAMSRHELFATTPDWVNVDHRRPAILEQGGLNASLHSLWNRVPDISFRIEAVHRSSSLGAVCTHVAHGVSQDGFDAEWRGIEVMTVEGDLINRCEIFDEADLDAAVARFEKLTPAVARFEKLTPKVRRLENTATRVWERLRSFFDARDFDAMAEMYAENHFHDDRRRITGGGIRRGRNASVENMRVVADLVEKIAAEAIAVRGERLVLARVRYWGLDKQPQAFLLEMLCIVETNLYDRMCAFVAFEPDDSEAAIAELDARYLAGEAAPYAAAWQIAVDILGEVNRHAPGPLLSRLAYTDHRRVPFAPSEFGRAVEELWPLVPDARYRVTEVHALEIHGAVASLVIEGTDEHGNELLWPRTILLDTGEPRLEVYEEGDVDTALARFKELRPRSEQLENAASRVADRVMAYFTAREWDEAAELVADDFSSDDRRRTVNAGILRGRNAAMKDAHAHADVGTKEITSTVVATRGERLVLCRARAHLSSSAEGPDAFYVDALVIYEIDGDGRVVAAVTFDPDQIDSAFEELDARYLAGEADPHAHTWSVIAEGFASLNRHEIPATTPDFVDIDHRPLALASGDLKAYLSATFGEAAHTSVYAAAVHLLTDLGAVVTLAGSRTSPEGFDEAEWRMIDIFTVEGDAVDRCEIFDEADLDAALARFEELQPQPPRLENAASQVIERFQADFAARNWDAIAEKSAEGIFTDDRRSIVSSGILHGRDMDIANIRTVSELGSAYLTSTVIAIRGDRVALSRFRLSGRDQRPEAFRTDMLGVVEIDADSRVTGRILFDLDDIHAAFEELDRRYLAGEAAAHAHTWSVIAETYATFNRHELPAKDWRIIDHRPLVGVSSVSAAAVIGSVWDLAPDLSIQIEAVHRLSGIGAVITVKAYGTSPEGFAAEWRMIHLQIVEGDRVDSCELFDEADLDAALARFEELQPRTPRLENAASQVAERFLARFGENNWDAMAELLADDLRNEDRRRVVGAGIRHGRDAQIADMRAVADVFATNVTSIVIATRGGNLALMRPCFSSRDQGPEAFVTEPLTLVGINADERIVDIVSFDVDDINAAFEELDRRYLAGEAADYAHTWSVIVGAYTSLHRREMPATTPHFADVDHRPLAAIGSGDLKAYLRAALRDTSYQSSFVVAVHRLTGFGAVVTHAASGTSREGFDAEWRMTAIYTVEGQLLDRCELFDEADLDAALARFEEMQPQAPRLENAATRASERLRAFLAADDWAGITAIPAEDIVTHDRRPIIGAGFARGRDVNVEFLRASSEIGLENLTAPVIAIRGERLALDRLRYSGRDEGPEPFYSEMLRVLEVDAEQRITAGVYFDVNDTNTAYEELDRRYLAGEAAAYAHTWSIVSNAYAAIRRHELFATTSDWVNVDHRRPGIPEEGGLNASLQSLWNLVPDIKFRVEKVQRLSSVGAVCTHVAHGASQDGFDAEWRGIEVMTVEGDLINRCEIFDEADLDAALARFEELQPRAPRLENVASRASVRYLEHINALDWDAVAGMLAGGYHADDRRHVIGSGILSRDAAIASVQEQANLGVTHRAATVIAVRGERLVLSRIRYSGYEEGLEMFFAEILMIVEISAEDQFVSAVVFDVDDIDTAYEELDRRYLAGEAAAHARTWSVIARTYAGFNRQQLPATTPDWVYTDHRPLVSTDASDLPTYIRAGWDLMKYVGIYMEAVHRLTDLGVVVTHTARGVSDEDFHAEWRMVDIFTVDGDLISRCEMFDESDLDAALARFDQLGGTS